MDSVIRMVCLLGVVCSIITIAFNTNLVLKIVIKKSKRKDDMMMFYYRFVIDVLLGISIFIFIIFVLLQMEYPDVLQNYRSSLVWFSLPWSNLAACRSIIALSISTERFLAAYFPIAYHTGKCTLPHGIVLSVAISFGLSEELVLFGFCAYDFEIPPTCKAFGCAVNKCFYSFWTIHKAANRLALLQTVTVLFFDFLPSFCGSISTWIIFNFDFIGPYIAVGKITGCAIEAVVVSSLLVFHKSKKSENTISSHFTKFWRSSMSTKHVITL